MLQDILKEFEERFVYDYFDNTGLKILGVRAENRPSSYSDIEDFITNTYNTARKELVEEVLITITTHSEDEDLGVCDTGEDMERACRSECVEMAVKRVKELLK